MKLYSRFLPVLALAGATAFGATLEPSGACLDGQLSTYITPGFSCSFATVMHEGQPYFLTISQVSFATDDIGLRQGGTASTFATPAQINVTAPTSLNDTLGFQSDVFAIGPGQRALYFFQYVIDPPPPVIPGFDIEMLAFSPVAPGSARVTVDVCPDGSFSSIGCLTPQGITPIISTELFHTGGPSCDVCKGSLDFDPVSRLSVRITIDLNTLKGGTSNIDGFRTNVAAAIPEPAGWVLGGAGLVLIGLLRRRR